MRSVRHARPAEDVPRLAGRRGETDVDGARGVHLHGGSRPRSESVLVSRRLIVTADYKQLEVCVAAALSRDPVMMAILAEGRDMHRATGAAIFNTAEQDVSAEQRQRGKTTNFLVQFGGGPSKLIEGSEKLVLERPDLGLTIPTLEEAQHAIRSHKRLYQRY